MARRCDYCAKRPLVGNKVSHSNIKTKTRSLPNLQRVRAVMNGKVTRVSVCTRCIRTGVVQKPSFRGPIVAKLAEAAAAAAASVA